MKIRLRSSKLAGGLGLLLALVLIIALGVPAGAQFFPGTYHQFFGSVKICDELVLTGDVTARIDGSTVEWTTPINASGNYGYTPDFLMIPIDDPETPEKDGGVDGVDTVRFYVQDRLAGEALFETDEPYWTLLDLQVTDVYLETNADPPAGGTVTGADTYDCSTIVDVEAIPTDECWYFTGWTGDLSGTENPTTIHMDGDKTVTASFAKFEYTLTVVASPIEGGTVTGADTYDCSTIVDVEAIPTDECWYFTGWTGDLTGDVNPTTVHMDGDKSVTAHFASVEAYDLTVTSDGCCTITVGDLGTVDPGAVEVLFPDIPYGTEVELEAVAPDCCVFDGWVVDDGDPVQDNPITVTMDDFHTAVATCHVPEYTLTLVANPPAGGTVTGAGTYTCSTNAPVEALPAGGWEFTGWSGDLTGDVNPTTVHMDEDKTVTANFTLPGTLGLVAGVNIIAYNGTTTDLPDALTNIGPVVDIIWARGAWTGGEWLWYDPGILLNTLSQLETDRAYIIVVTEDCTWELP